MATESVSRTATCKRCGSTTVTWQRGTTGRWYLTEVFNYSLPGETDNERTEHRDFHSAYCGKPLMHDARQSAVLADLTFEKADQEARDEKREQERLDDEADKLAAWYAMTPDEQTTKIAVLELEIKRELRGITMDYMTEFIKAQAAAAALRAEIDLYLADQYDENDNDEQEDN